MAVRLDKWLQIARVFKTRARATRACSLRRVRVNGSPAKPHRSLSLEDHVEVDFGDWRRILIVRELRERTLPKAEAPRVYEDRSPPRPVPDPLERLRRRPVVSRERGMGRPTKQDRRNIERFLQQSRSQPSASDPGDE